MNAFTKGITLILLGVGMAIVSKIFGQIIQSIVRIDDFERGVFCGFVVSTIFYVIITLFDNEKPKNGLKKSDKDVKLDGTVSDAKTIDDSDKNTIHY